MSPDEIIAKTFVIMLAGLAGLAGILNIGKARTPVTPQQALAALILNIGVAVCVIIYWD